ncbi:MAG: CRISPR-associated protein Csx20 [Raineya sp.]
MRLFLIFSHTLTPKQIEDAQNNWGIKQFIPLPEALQELWSNIPPELASLKSYLQPLLAWLEDNNISPQDTFLIQGDYGATYLLVQWCHQKGLKALYSTTERIVEEFLENNKVSIRKTFQHCRFREYERNETW